ncbi:MAG: tetratricopeptide repeat protein [Myxococcales bacterium]|nr:MAG: tetratricopeptide repeat protein [Myxococcales bacterium]
MRHQCSSCFGEFFDDASSSSPPERVFCVFCGTELPAPPAAGSSAVPFSADYPREEAFALGVIGGASPGFPDTLRQFRAHGAPPDMDSLAPVHHEPEPSTRSAGAPAWRLGRFWTSLVVGFAVGACAAVLLAERAESPRASASPQPREARPNAPPAIVLSGCAASPAPSAAAIDPPRESKPAVTPLLEKRFWLERARNAQRQYRLTEAERFYRRALSQSPRDSEALAGLGELELLRGEPASADARFREAVEANADYVPARVALADLHWQSGRSDDARREYRDIVTQYSADLFPPYVAQRLEGDACVPQCGEAAASVPPPAALP